MPGREEDGVNILYVVISEYLKLQGLTGGVVEGNKIKLKSFD